MLGNKFLFMANKNPDSKLMVMTMIKQISTIDVIVLGKIIFKEKNIIKKLLYSILIFLGIMLILIS